MEKTMVSHFFSFTYHRSHTHVQHPPPLLILQSFDIEDIIDRCLQLSLFLELNQARNRSTNRASRRGENNINLRCGGIEHNGKNNGSASHCGPSVHGGP